MCSLSVIKQVSSCVLWISTLFSFTKEKSLASFLLSLTPIVKQIPFKGQPALISVQNPSIIKVFSVGLIAKTLWIGATSVCYLLF